jgi:hypothetical protein
MEAHRSDAAQTIKLSPQFYRRLYRGLLKFVFINSIILSTLCILTIYLSFYGFKPEHYFTTSQSGGILELPYRVTPPYPKPVSESPTQHAQPTQQTH